MRPTGQAWERRAPRRCDERDLRAGTHLRKHHNGGLEKYDEVLGKRPNMGRKRLRRPVHRAQTDAVVRARWSAVGGDPCRLQTKKLSHLGWRDGLPLRRDPTDRLFRAATAVALHGPTWSESK